MVKTLNQWLREWGGIDSGVATLEGASKRFYRDLRHPPEPIPITAGGRKIPIYAAVQVKNFSPETSSILVATGKAARMPDKKNGIGVLEYDDNGKFVGDDDFGLTASWFYRHSVKRKKAPVVCRLSLNVLPSPALIEALDKILAADGGAHIDSYKSPTDLSSWLKRYDPINVYLHDKDAATIAKIVAAAKPYVRTAYDVKMIGQKVGDGVFFDTEPTRGGMAALLKRAEKEAPALYPALYGMNAEKAKDGKIYGKYVSAGQFYAAENLVDSYAAAVKKGEIDKDSAEAFREWSLAWRRDVPGGGGQLVHTEEEIVKANEKYYDLLLSQSSESERARVLNGVVDFGEIYHNRVKDERFTKVRSASVQSEPSSYDRVGEGWISKTLGKFGFAVEKYSRKESSYDGVQVLDNENPKNIAAQDKTILAVGREWREQHKAEYARDAEELGNLFRIYAAGIGKPQMSPVYSLEPLANDRLRRPKAVKPEPERVKDLLLRLGIASWTEMPDGTIVLPQGRPSVDEAVRGISAAWKASASKSKSDVIDSNALGKTR
ncbi:MAG: hypothetical protein LBL52_00030 [Rickettsiales bacterium]|jgi:hypothetical protein|nr:hypothetical protein [Rickettsiales bacterium]